MAKLVETRAQFFERQRRYSKEHRTELDGYKLRSTVTTAVNAAMRTATPTAPPVTAEQRAARAFDAYIRSGKFTREARDMGAATGAAGGYLVPTTFNADIVHDMTAMSALFGHTTVVDTSADPHPGAPMNFPTMIDAGNVAGILAEDAAYTGVDAVFGNIAWPEAQAYSAGEFARVSFALANDAGFDLSEVLRQAWVARTARGIEEDMTSTLKGSGASSVTMSALTTFDPAHLVYVWSALNATYRADAIWVFSPSAMAALMNSVDGAGHPLLVFSAPWSRDTDSTGAVQMIPTLFGNKVFESNGGWAAQAASGGGICGAFVNVGKALPVRYSGSSVSVLRERFADYGENGYSGYSRFNATTLALTSACVLITNQA